MKEINDRDEKQSRPFWYARLCVKRWYLVLAVAITVPLACAGIVLATGAIELTVESEYQYVIRHDPIVQDGLAVVEASRMLRAEIEKIVDEEKPRERDLGWWRITVYYRSLKGNVLTAESFNAQNAIEREAQEFQGYEDFCYQDSERTNCEGEIPTCTLPNSVLLVATGGAPSLFGRSEPLRGVCDYSDRESVTKEEVQEIVPNWFQGEDGGQLPAVNWYLGDDANATSPSTAYVRSAFKVGYPLTGFNESKDQWEEQNDLYLAWATEFRSRIYSLAGDDFEIHVYSPSMYENDISNLAASDFVWVAGSVAFVGVYMCIHTGSIYLGLTGMLQIVLAFPLTYFFYRFIFQVTFFSSLHLLAVFLILGIGADDVFVFTDAFVQAEGVLGRSSDLVERMSWSYRRAAKAMLITSFTTAAAFFVTATNDLTPISAFGIWAASLIILQYVLCIAMFPANLAVWHKHFRYRYWRKYLRKVDPLTEEIPGSPRDEEKRKELEESGGELDGAREATACCFCVPVDSRYDKYAEREAGGEDYAGTRGVEKFFHSVWSPLLARLRYFTLALAAIIIGLAVFGATQLQPLFEEEEFIPETHPIQQPLVWAQSFFGAGVAEGRITVTVVHGIKGIDQSKVKRWDPDDIGTPVFDESFNLTRGDVRNFLVQQCDTFRRDPVLTLKPSSASCWIKDYQQKWLPMWGQDPSQDMSERAFFQSVMLFLQYEDPETERRPYVDYLDQIGISMDEERVIVSLSRFRTPAKSLQGFRKTLAVYELWNSVMEEQNAVAPLSASAGYATAIDFIYMVTEKNLVESAVKGLGISLSVAFGAIAISTFNIIMAFYAISAVSAIVACMIALMWAYGWNWGISESVGVVLIVGFSVDYVVHIANAYVESYNRQRYRRTRDALTEMGISVVAGAITTFGSGVFLVGSTIIFFDKFGVILMTTIALSLLWSTVGFSTLVITVGPSDQFGSFWPLIALVLRWITAACRWLLSLVHRVGCCWRQSSAQAEDAGEGQTDSEEHNNAAEVRAQTDEAAAQVGDAV